MNHYGRTEYGEGYNEEDSGKKVRYPMTKSKVKTSIKQKPAKHKLLFRIPLIILCLVMISLGINAIAGGSWSYNNWWGGLVFGPLAILAGVLFMFIVIFKWKNLFD